MLETKAEDFVEAGSYLSRLRESSEKVAMIQRSRGQGDRPLTPSEREASGIDERLRDLRTRCEALGLRMTIKQIDRCLALSELQAVAIVAFSVEILDRFQDELEEHPFVSLTSEEAVLFKQPLKGWETVVERFGSAFDVEEARKCLAFERYTAAVFHLMKIVESGVLELQLFLQTPDVKAHFGSVVSKLEDMTQKQRYDHISPRLQSHLPFLREVLTQLHAVKDSWRNKVTHVDAFIIPSETFTAEMALGAHDATLLLMKKLCGGLPPKAASTV